MSSTLLPTKLYISPTRPEWVPRPRLLEALNKGLSQKLTLISAPAGFGKTTLLSAWAAQSNTPVAWLSLDTEDNDAARFLTYVVSALRTLDTSIGEASLALLQSPQPASAPAVLSALINDIVHVQDRGRVVLVLDDYHVINAQVVHDALIFLLDHLPPQMHLVIATRVDPPLPLARLRGSGQLNELRTEALRFVREETNAFLNQTMALDLSADDVSALETRTEGWIVGLQLAALSMQGREDMHDFVVSFAGSHRYVLDYLTEEVLNRQAVDVQNFMLQTSILDRLTGELCDAVTGQENGQEILRWLDQANLFIVPMDDERLWYRYHHLFGDMLRRHLFNARHDRISELHRRASAWYEIAGNCGGAVQQKHHQASVCHETGGYCGDAIQHALASNDLALAGRLVEQCSRQTFERSELATIMKWVAALPEATIANRPWLCIFHAWALRLSGAQFDAVESRLQDAELAIEKHDSLSDSEARKMMGHLAAIRAYQALYKEDIPRVMELANQALGHLPGENFVRGLTGLALGWASRFAGDLVGAEQALTESTTSSLEAGNTYGAVSAMCRAAYGQVLGGQLHQADRTCQEALRLATIKEGLQLPVAGYAHVYLGGVHLQWNDLEAAEGHLVTGIDQCSQVGYIMDQIVGYTTLARVRQARRDWEGAADALSNAERLCQRMKGYLYAQRWVEDCQIRLWIGQGNIASAARWTQECGLGVDDELTFMRELEHIILARALVAQGQERPDQVYLDDALHLLARLLDTAVDAGWMGKSIEILALQAVALQARGETKEALQTLERALSLAEPEGYIRVFIDEGAPMAELLRLAGAQGINTSYAGQLLSAFSSPAEPLSSSVDSLSERELEVLRLLAIGLSNSEIAEELVVATGTVKSHTGSIYSKLGVRNRTEAVARARELRLL